MEEKKKATAAHMRATQKYEQENYKKILLRIRNDGKDGGPRYDDLVLSASRAAKSLNGYILEAIQEKIYRDNQNINN